MDASGGNEIGAGQRHYRRPVFLITGQFMGEEFWQRVTRQTSPAKGSDGLFYSLELAGSSLLQP